MGSLFTSQVVEVKEFKMRSLVLLLAPLAMAATMGSNKGRDSRHYWGQNMTVPRSFQNMGSINVAGVGQLYVVTQDPSTVQMVDNGFRLVGGGRVYLAQEAANDFSNPFIYWQAPLLGNHISYTVDVSNVGCHCNSAFYFAQNTTHGRAIEKPSTCNFTHATMWRPTTIPTVMAVVVAQTLAMESPGNMDLEEPSTQTSLFWFRTLRFEAEMD